MYKVFYNPSTLEIKGHSDGAITMELPYVETDYCIALFENFKIEMIEDVATLSPIKMQFTDAEWDNLINR